MTCFCFLFFMSLVCLFSWIDNFLSLIVEQSVSSLILQPFDGSLVTMLSGLLVVSMFSGLLLLSDISEITALVLEVLLLVFEFNLFFFPLLPETGYFVVLFRSFIKSILRYMGHILFSEDSFTDLFFSFISSLRKKISLKRVKCDSANMKRFRFLYCYLYCF